MSGTARVQQHREKLRKAGLRPIQIWVPDTRNPNFPSECKRQCKLVRKSDEKDKGLDQFLDDAFANIEGWED